MWEPAPKDLQIWLAKTVIFYCAPKSEARPTTAPFWQIVKCKQDSLENTDDDQHLPQTSYEDDASLLTRNIRKLLNTGIKMPARKVAPYII